MLFRFLTPGLIYASEAAAAMTKLHHNCSPDIAVAPPSHPLPLALHVQIPSDLTPPSGGLQEAKGLGADRFRRLAS